MQRQLDSGPRHDNDASPLEPGSSPPLPAGLGEALDAFAADAVLRGALGESFCQSYERLRRRPWDAWRSEVSDGARRHGLDG